MKVEPVSFAILRPFFKLVNLLSETIQTLTALFVEGAHKSLVALGEPPNGQQEENRHRAGF
jgi:hypothetical protein